MKFAIYPRGPIDALMNKAKQISPSTPILILDDTTYLDEDLMLVFVFKQYRPQVESFNTRRTKSELPRFSIIEVPLEKEEKRPIVSKNSIRKRIAEILKDGPAYGYEIYKKYRESFGSVSLRLIYYHISRGVKEGLFEVADIQEKKGDFSWGKSAQHIYYKLKAPYE